ncbi:MAG: hypothetical protein QNJ07_05670 [Woeseiaceae bacterium]|nr:hypothetical protein [Woeseiaceae bacterium]
MSTKTLYRPVGPAELDLIRDSGWQEFPPRLPEQPIFYPVLNLDEFNSNIVGPIQVVESFGSADE